MGTTYLGAYGSSCEKSKWDVSNVHNQQMLFEGIRKKMITYILYGLSQFFPYFANTSIIFCL